MPRISFRDDGVCNYCEIHDELDKKYPAGAEGERQLKALANRIKESAKGKKYDCVVGVSGGCDSSYLVVRLVELGLNPLAVHFDNTWNSEIATQNIYKVLNALGVDLHTYVVDSREYDDILRAFMLSGTKNLDAALDIGLASVLYATAEAHGLKYVVEGHSFRTEGIAPLDWSYMDGRYIASVHRQFGTRAMKTYPNMSLWQFLRWTAVRGIQRVRPLYNMEYPKEEVKAMLADQYDWQWYGGHHLENRFTAFFVNYVLTRRWNNDLRYLGHAALVRSGQLDRQQALNELSQPVDFDVDVKNLVQKRLGFDDAELERVMTLPHKTWRDFPNYKRTFERLRPLFALLVKTGRVPESFYMKFCFPNELGEDGEPATRTNGGAQAQS
ncbi:MAG: LPS biosynthesis protein [Alphaproteobacteria bacterium]|nr:LPS biosynthesis protein [Alphaproteobacteria bacterium]